jgi:hypothetical protein
MICPRDFGYHGAPRRDKRCRNGPRRPVGALLVGKHLERVAVTQIATIGDQQGAGDEA